MKYILSILLILPILNLMAGSEEDRLLQEYEMRYGKLQNKKRWFGLSKVKTKPKDTFLRRPKLSSIPRIIGGNTLPPLPSPPNLSAICVLVD